MLGCLVNRCVWRESAFVVEVAEGTDYMSFRIALDVLSVTVVSLLSPFAHVVICWMHPVLHVPNVASRCPRMRGSNKVEPRRWPRDACCL